MKKYLSLLGGALIEKHYSGRRAENYEKGRGNSVRWSFEEQSLEKILGSLPENEIETIGDIPSGTGRFVTLFESLRGVQRVYGLDYSPDMLLEALRKGGKKSFYAVQDIIASPPSCKFDTAVCFRFLNLFNLLDVSRIVRNISVSTKYNFIFTIRLVEDSSLNGKILNNKIHLHCRRAFLEMLSSAGLVVQSSCKFESDDKEGEYFVMHSVKKAIRGEE